MSHATRLSISKECIVHCRIVSLSHSFILPSIFVVPLYVQREIEEFFLPQLEQSLCQYF